MQSLRLSMGCVLAGGLVLTAVATHAQNAFAPGGNDYSITGPLAGDQTAPQMVIVAGGGYAVWQDNAADTSGLGIRATRLDANLNRTGPFFRVNSITSGDQEKPQLAALTNGGAVFVWQGGQQGFQKIYARFLQPTGTNFLSTDIQVSTNTGSQLDPCVATLTDGSVVVVWANYGQDGDRQGIFGRRFTAAGVTNGAEFQINQFILNNQRTPSVAALAGGGFVVTWISELERNAASVDVYARVYNASGVASGSEFAVNTEANHICANPTVAGGPDGGFAVAWSRRDAVSTNIMSLNPTSGTQTTFTGTRGEAGWDVYARQFSSNGLALRPDFRLNSYVDRDQYAPRISSFGSSYLAIWNSMGQDYWLEGVYGQFFSAAGDMFGQEFRVNSDTGNRQFFPSVSSDNVNRFLVAWSSFSTSGTIDIFGRSYDLIRVSIAPVAGGVRVSWNTRPGITYQVQSSADNKNWSNFGSARAAAGYSDSIDIVGGSNFTAYRVVRIQN